MFSKACEYGLRATLFIALKSRKELRSSVEEIAVAIDAPQAFTAKILQQLQRGNVVQSVKGPNGGFFLTPTTSKQPIWNILVAFGEDERLTNCIMGLQVCNDTRPCPMHKQYKVMKKQLVALFKENVIADIAETMQRSRFFIGNQGV